MASSGEEADKACDEEDMLGGAEELESEGDESEEEESEEEGSEVEEEQEEDTDVDALPEGCQPPSQVSMGERIKQSAVQVAPQMHCNTKG